MYYVKYFSGNRVLKRMCGRLIVHNVQLLCDEIKDRAAM